MSNYAPVNYWAIRTSNPIGLEFLSEPTHDGRFYYALSYPIKIISLWDKSDPTDKGFEHENKVLDKLCIFEDGTKQALGWNDIFETEEEAKKAFKERVKLSEGLLKDIKDLEVFLNS